MCIFGLAYLSLKEEIKHNFTKGRKSILQDIEENLFFISKLIRLTTYWERVLKWIGLLLVNW
ncbi:hypothetical protein LEP1GSC021_2142 [Leptospira noguchii str. 1993005606]|uniref:Uncharacterized protein n=2 Tax=Leptospira noguchii TaxID=28182 RepID=M6YFX2_9LEPT|nr:hypothetical protein LEP1GSC035_4060 [Leptospira noguchii str. 2007001578]EMO90741.1 hypothetical protein LEP1GSC024_0343 [Leptospira noguchii str. 2001034031]EPE86221.1 hypothetical protein LEP1GSC021_2142 [Leptospira noguchii str. 1993005606]